MENQNEEVSKILDWDELSTSDKERATQLLKELNGIFDKYYPRKTKDDEAGDQR